MLSELIEEAYDSARDYHAAQTGNNRPKINYVNIAQPSSFTVNPGGKQVSVHVFYDLTPHRIRMVSVDYTDDKPCDFNDAELSRLTRFIERPINIGGCNSLQVFEDEIFSQWFKIEVGYCISKFIFNAEPAGLADCSLSRNLINKLGELLDLRFKTQTKAVLPGFFVELSKIPKIYKLLSENKILLNFCDEEYPIPFSNSQYKSNITLDVHGRHYRILQLESGDDGRLVQFTDSLVCTGKSIDDMEEILNYFIELKNMPFALKGYNIYQSGMHRLINIVCRRYKHKKTVMLHLGGTRTFLDNFLECDIELVL